MHEAQIDLLEKTLRMIGWLALVLGILILSLGISNKIDLEDICDIHEGALIVWPPFIIGVVALWSRAFIRAGRRSV
ncbi:MULTISPECIES: hypothetical protein [unclassified Pseudomonas]|jgi:hypothetical protein|uniref:hypothetical protein n=1 Tax=unclassified Pseudomonas TaxID=196821 RepID=UPI000F57EEEE|nr:MULTISPECIES: hypothetical protein [unclassified Pseudomonas]AZF63742.1 hypothetical protein C4J83_2753 [Pseudomonas sp. LBUM920]MCU1776191.1 hypothetical protein [Pseudomonas sp. 14P_5.3_Bac1]